MICLFSLCTGVTFSASFFSLFSRCTLGVFSEAVLTRLGRLLDPLALTEIFIYLGGLWCERKGEAGSTRAATHSV